MEIFVYLVFFGLGSLHLVRRGEQKKIYTYRHPIVLEKSTTPWFRTSFHENAWNMANRSNFVKIVIFVSFFWNVLLFRGTKHKRPEKQNATRAQICATRAQFCATRGQFEKVVITLCKNTLARSFTFLEGNHFFVKRHRNCWNVNFSIRDTFF